MKLLLSLFILLVAVSGLDAQMILLKSGESVPATTFQRQGDLLMVAVTNSTGSKGQVAYYISDVVELQFPQPPEMIATSDLIAKGRAARALEVIEPIVAFQKTIRDIPGNWWAKTALVKCTALVALNRPADAELILKDIATTSTEPEIQLAAKLQLALLDPPKDPAVALAAYDGVISQSTDTKTLTQAWLAEGDLYLAQHQADEALMAYLTVTVFYPQNNPQVPRALWGAAQAYAKLKDSKNQDLTLNDIVTHYPDNPEASLAKAEIMKKENQQ